MNKIKLICLSSFLVSGLASATPVCDAMQIKLTNILADDLLITKIKLDGAQIQPGFFEKLKSKTSQVFTINGSTDNMPMAGEFVLHTISLPSKKVTIRYTLENTLTSCVHQDASPVSDYAIERTSTLNEVKYSIINR